MRTANESQAVRKRFHFAARLTTTSSIYRVAPRTPVIKNDPLGALNEKDEAKTSDKTINTHTKEEDETIKIRSTIYSDQPILFKGQRSATFDESMSSSKSMHRSKTMPSSFAAIGSSFKFHFG